MSVGMRKGDEGDTGLMNGGADGCAGFVDVRVLSDGNVFGCGEISRAG